MQRANGPVGKERGAATPLPHSRPRNRPHFGASVSGPPPLPARAITHCWRCGRPSGARLSLRPQPILAHLGLDGSVGVGVERARRKENPAGATTPVTSTAKQPAVTSCDVTALRPRPSPGGMAASALAAGVRVWDAGVGRASQRVPPPTEGSKLSFYAKPCTRRYGSRGRAEGWPRPVVALIVFPVTPAPTITLPAASPVRNIKPPGEGEDGQVAD
ncbi:hypothetical protein O3P69_013716 [Scylla paramamosain]|uniref:Uncharacterized protein n=1 Tax=Scylla paramamosain TaxID=85552 RepID=A0AAW0SRD0_SCYPA